MSSASPVLQVNWPFVLFHHFHSFLFIAVIFGGATEPFFSPQAACGSLMNQLKSKLEALNAFSQKSKTKAVFK